MAQEARRSGLQTSDSSFGAGREKSRPAF